ncbi:MAG: serine/threonine protein kinase [Acidobacteria bacterium]|nr:MAG: serine/threonine protein kinase [Acidobacteriota bacterium]
MTSSLAAPTQKRGRLMRSDVAKGSHRIRLSRRDYADLAEDIEIEPEGETLYQVTLAPMLPEAGRPREAADDVADAVAVEAVEPTPVVIEEPEEELSRSWLLGGLAFGFSALVFAFSRWRKAPEETLATVTAGALKDRSSVSQGSKTSERGADDATLTKVSDTTQGSRFGEFRLIKRLGQGGMASVYLAERNGEQYALKKPLSSLLKDEEFRERFLREANIGRTLHHPNIIRIFEKGEVNDVPYFTMEIVTGDTLREKLTKHELSQPRDAAAVILQIAEALDYAHLKGVIHRDLKPSNIMIMENGVVKVMDYGIARAQRFGNLTATGAFLGTPNYVAPETAEGKTTDARGDLYSLGIIFYEMLTRQRPFDADNPLVTLRKHCTEPPTPPSVIAPGVPRRLETMILKLLAKSPDDRYPDAEHLLVELRGYLSKSS